MNKYADDVIVINNNIHIKCKYYGATTFPIYLPRPIECKGGVYYYCANVKCGKIVLKGCKNPEKDCDECGVSEK